MIPLLSIREYFSMVSIETKTIVETIENAQGFDLKKTKPVGFRVVIQGYDRNPGRNYDCIDVCVMLLPRLSMLYISL